MATSTSTSTSGPAMAELGQLHVSCFITAANRATPVFEVLPERHCLRVATKSTSSSKHDAGPAATAAAATLQAEWELQTVFASSAARHASEFYREIALPALRIVRSGLNVNVLAVGIHPTQKFRLLFGKSAASDVEPMHGNGDANSVAIDREIAMDAHGQVGAVLAEYFELVGSSRDANADAHLGMSSWLIVNNQAIDLLRDAAATTTTSSASTGSAMRFVSLEAPTFATAMRLLQIAKTNRIVVKQNAEHSHFFVRLAFFQQGRLSTLHVVDIADLKESQDATNVQEKQEFYELLQELGVANASSSTSLASIATNVARRSPPTSPPRSSIVTKQTPTSAAAAAAMKKTQLWHFLHPMLLLNAKTFIYANVIDSRASLRESVALLNALVKTKGFACMCRRLDGVAFAQLGFEPCVAAPTTTAHGECNGLPSEPTRLDAAAAKAMAAVALGESLLHRLTAPPAAVPPKPPLTPSPSIASSVCPSPSTDAAAWLDAFTQRKKSILAGVTSGTSVLPLTSTPSPSASIAPVPSATASMQTAANAIAGSGNATSGWSPPMLHRGSGTASSSSIELYERLKSTLQRPIAPPSSSRGAAFQQTQTASPMPLAVPASASAPLPISDLDDALPPPPPPPLPSTTTSCSLQDALKRVNLPPHVPPAPQVDGLDTATATKIQHADAQLLRKNYDALLLIAQEQQRLREAAELKASEVVRDHAELQAAQDVQLESLKLELVQLKRKLRVLEQHSRVSQVLAQYEEEAAQMQTELQHLRAQNVQLELRLASAPSPAATSSLDMDSSTDAAAALVDLKKRYAAMAQARQQLEDQVRAFRKRERHLAAHAHVVQESTRKVDQLARQLAEKEDALVSTRLHKARLSAAVEQAQQDALDLQQENERLLQQHAATTEELLGVRMCLASIENEKKKASMLDLFVQKHGDRMRRIRSSSALPTPSAIAADTKENWRRDADAKESEDKLLHGVKRGLPQLMPVLNKVLRRLEVQELSLREYCEREVDFINLLVELVSDQPALTLKSMIEQEMKKLTVC